MENAINMDLKQVSQWLKVDKQTWDVKKTNFGFMNKRKTWHQLEIEMESEVLHSVSLTKSLDVKKITWQ